MADANVTIGVIASVDESGAPTSQPLPSTANTQSQHVTGSSSLVSTLRRFLGVSSNGQHGRRFLARVFACINPRASGLEQAHSIAEFQSQIALLAPTYEPQSPLLRDASAAVADKPCLVLDLDETLVHSSFSPIDAADFEIPLNMQGETHTVFVKKRPGVDNFLAVVSESFEVVVFTASLALYANPVMDLLDPACRVHERLYREHCVLIGGCYVKDIAKLGRDLKRTIIIDNSPLSYALQPENAIPIDSFFADENDRELDKILVILEKAKNLQDVRNLAR